MTILEVRCMIGLHVWVYLGRGKRVCHGCGRREVLCYQMKYRKKEDT